MATLPKNCAESKRFGHENSDKFALNATRESVIETWLREYKRLESMPKDKLIRMIIGDRPVTKKKLFEDSEDIWLNEFRIELFNSLFQKGFNVYKAREVGADRFIVMAELPTGQISKHYEMKDWDKFQIPEKEFADKQNEHSPRNVAKLTVLQRIRRLIKELL